MPDPRIGTKTSGIYSVIPTQYSDGTAFSSAALATSTLYFFTSSNFTVLPTGVTTISSALETQLLALVGSTASLSSLTTLRAGLGIQPINSFELFDEFAIGTLSSTTWSTNTNGTGAAVTETIGTGLTVANFATGNDSGGFATLASNVSFLSNATTLLLEGYIRLSALTETALEFGFSDAKSETGGLAFSSVDSTPVAVATNGAVISYLNSASEGNTVFNLVSVNAGTAARTVSTTTVAANTWYHLAVALVKNGSNIDVGYYINSTLVTTRASAIASNIPLYAWVSLKSSNTTGKTSNLDYIRVAIAR